MVTKEQQGDDSSNVNIHSNIDGNSNSNSNSNCNSNNETIVSSKSTIPEEGKKVLEKTRSEEILFYETQGCDNVGIGPSSTQMSNEYVDMKGKSNDTDFASTKTTIARPPVIGNRAISLDTAKMEFDYNNNNSGGKKSSRYISNRRPKPTRVSLSLRELSQISPLECEAETYILRTVEENDPTLTIYGPSEAEQSILRNVPFDIAHNFDTNTAIGTTIPTTIATAPAPVLAIDDHDVPSNSIERQQSTMMNRARTKPPIINTRHKRTMSTEESLFQLTEGLVQLQNTKQNHNHASNGNDVCDNDGLALLDNDMFELTKQASSGDILASSAAKVLRRRNAQKFLSNQKEMAAQQQKQHPPVPTKVTAKERWKQISATIDTGDVVRNTGTYGKNELGTTTSVSADYGVIPVTMNSPNNKTTSINSSTTTSINNNNNNNTSPKKMKVDEEFGIVDGDDNNENKDHHTNIDNVSPFPSNSNMSIRKQQGMPRSAKVELNQGYRDFETWLKMKRSNIMFHVKLLFFLVIPAIGVAAILFYVFENPPCGTTVQCTESVANSNLTNGTGSDLEEFIFADASYSWWILFICVRHALMITLAAATKAFVIDFLCVRTRALLTVTGPVVTLFTVQSKGWPFLLSSWSIYSFALLYGKHPFAQHWLFFQDGIALFTDANPSGGITSLPAYRKVLILALAVGVAVTIKRFWIGITIGRHTFSRYASDLAKLMAKVLLVGQVAEIARDIESYGYKLDDFQLDHELFTKTISREEENGDDTDSTDLNKPGLNRNTTSGTYVPAPFELGKERVFGLRKDFSGTAARNKINQLLGEWEEPQEVRSSQGNIKISSIIQFRTSLSCLNTTVPFGPAFGNAATRQECIVSTEELFHRLLLATPGKSVLTFDTLAMVAINDDGKLDEEKVRDLIRVFRPDREGNLTLIDFAKSIDSVYKELRLLRASVLNSSRMDRTFESIINIIFYFIMYCIILSILGLEPLVLFASVSGFILAFAFMIGAACSKYFEGIIFILIRRPYDIGDRVNISDPTKETDNTGSPTWYVRDVNLFTTTMCFAATNEVATYSNGSLAACRIINAARSPNAVVQFNLKFPIDTSYEKLQIFKRALEEFVKARPREYQSFTGFRCTRIEADLGYVQYIVLASHRESWQNLRSIVTSKAELASFGLELSKKMNLRYRSPPMPIDLRMTNATMKSFQMNNSMNDILDQRTTIPDNEDDSVIPDEDDMAELNAMFAHK